MRGPLRSARNCGAQNSLRGPLIFVASLHSRCFAAAFLHLRTASGGRLCSPRTRGEVNKPPRSRDAASHPSFASRFKKALPRASLKRREAERQKAHHWFPPRRREKACLRCGARYVRPLPRVGAELRRGGALAFRRSTAVMRRGTYLDSAPGRASWNHRIQTGGPSPAPVQPAPGSPVTRRTVDAQNRPDMQYIAAAPGTAPAPPRSTLAKASFVERDSLTRRNVTVLETLSICLC